MSRLYVYLYFYLMLSCYIQIYSLLDSWWWIEDVADNASTASAASARNPFSFDATVFWRTVDTSWSVLEVLALDLFLWHSWTFDARCHHKFPLPPRQDEDKLCEAVADDHGPRADGLPRRYRWLVPHHSSRFWLDVEISVGDSGSSSCGQFLHLCFKLHSEFSLLRMGLLGLLRPWSFQAFAAADHFDPYPVLCPGRWSEVKLKFWIWTRVAGRPRKTQKAS